MLFETKYSLKTCFFIVLSILDKNMVDGTEMINLTKETKIVIFFFENKK